MSGIPYSPNVVFDAGAPLDIAKLNRLQSNIAAVKIETDSRISNATQTIDGVQRNVRVSPVVYAGNVKVSISNNRGYSAVDFSGSNFTEIPTFVASLATNTKSEDQVVLRATATSKTGGEIEVFSGTKSVLKEVVVNFIAVQMKNID